MNDGDKDRERKRRKSEKGIRTLGVSASPPYRDSCASQLPTGSAKSRWHVIITHDVALFVGPFQALTARRRAKLSLQRECRNTGKSECRKIGKLEYREVGMSENRKVGISESRHVGMSERWNVGMSERWNVGEPESRREPSLSSGDFRGNISII